MPTFAALFRGVNVSGKNRVEMPRLQKLFVSFGYTNVETYVQSGNVIFSTGSDDGDSIAAIGEKIRNAVKKEFDADVPVLVVSAKILHNVLSDNPFLKSKGDGDKVEQVDPSALHFTFVAAKGSVEPGWDAPSEAITAKLDSMAQKSGEDTYRVSPYGLYLFLPKRLRPHRLDNNSLERTLKSVATTRNWKSITALATKTGAIE